MTTSKFATIHGGLLVRKGEAAPAVRHPVLEQAYVPPSRTTSAASAKDSASSDAARTPASAGADGSSAATIVMRRDPEQGTASCAFVEQRPRKGGRRTGRELTSKATIRLSGRQKHLMKIATAVLGRSQQDLVSAALDAYLVALGSNELRSCGCFARHLPGTQEASVEVLPAKSR